MSTPSILSAQLRLGSPVEQARALTRVRKALVRAGSVTGAAELLGVPAETLRRWVSKGHKNEIPAVSALVDELGLRRLARESGAEKKSPTVP
jgi:hypothetical protein